MPPTLQPSSSLGLTGMELSPIGLGTWAQGGGGWVLAWGPQDDRESEAAIRHAVEAGINWIDTAPAYGYGHAEELVGRVTATMPEADRPYVFTKVGLRWDPANPMSEPDLDLSADSIRLEVEDSLRRLRTERIDLLLVHWPPSADSSDAAVQEYWSVIVSLRDAGKIRAAGLSNHSTAQLAAAEKYGHVDSLQPPFSLIRRDAAADQIPWCAEHQTGVIVYGPLQAGLLSGAMTEARVAGLPADDWRASNREFTGDRLKRNLDLAQRLSLVARRHETTHAAVAIAWVLSWPGITGAIVGARRPAQIDDWAAAGRIRLGSQDLDEIAGAIAESSAGTGPARPKTR